MIYKTYEFKWDKNPKNKKNYESAGINFGGSHYYFSGAPTCSFDSDKIGF